MKEVTTGNGQQLEDIAIQEYGCEEGVITLLADNRLSMDDLLYPGQKLKVREEVPELTGNNRVMLMAIEREGVSPVSGIVGQIPDTHYAGEDYFGEDYVD
ncbi:MAG: LysM peptidoglycan-binding domain-containing protein [Bacteroidetes bacterium]|nr:LysM peptidoglycan-binding domain-containing protein [Bacteroidota bacterium]